MFLLLYLQTEEEEIVVDGPVPTLPIQTTNIPAAHLPPRHRSHAAATGRPSLVRVDTAPPTKTFPVPPHPVTLLCKQQNIGGAYV